jgi:HEAT repeat protein
MMEQEYDHGRYRPAHDQAPSTRALSREEPTDAGAMSPVAARALAAVGLGKIARQLEVHPEELDAALRNSDWSVRAAAVQVLGKRETPLDVLLRALHDEHGAVRAAAARSLALQAEKRADPVPGVIEALVAALRDPEWNVRAAAAQGLGRLKDTKSVEPLLFVMQDAHAAVRSASIWALGRMGDQAPIEKIEIGLQDSAWSVREATIMALQEQNERAPLSSLLEARLDDDATVRQMAEAALDERSHYGQGYYGAAHQYEEPQHAGQKLNPDSGVGVLSPWLRLLLATLSIGTFSLLMPMLLVNSYDYFFSLIHLAILLIICIALVSMNLSVQRKSFSALLLFQQGGGSPASPWPWMGVALAILSIIVLASQAGILESGFDYWNGAGADINMYHFIMICRIIALGVVAMTMLLINRIFHLR